ncbi:MAG: 23S rRNA (adenine(2503)-C(2))-methyltransferase @ tRNA (adenine(37)-C(2))-methyltransferase, partial [uncultured Thermomicrobiales bacterium]
GKRYPGPPQNPQHRLGEAPNASETAPRPVRPDAAGTRGAPRQEAVADLPGTPDLGLALPSIRARLRRDDDAAGRAPGRPFRRVADLDDGDGSDPLSRRRRDPEDPVPHRRRRTGRDGPHALPGPGDRLRLLPGRLRGRVRLLRDRARRPDPQPLGRRDGRAGGGGGAAGTGARPIADQPRDDGDGRTAPQLRRDDEDGRHPPRPGGNEPWGPADHHFDLRRGAPDRRAGRGAVAGQPGRLPPRPDRRPARPTRAHQPALPGYGTDGGLQPLYRADRAARLLRVRADAGDQRRRRDGAGVGGVAARRAVPRQHHPAQPRRRPPLRAAGRGWDRAVRRDPPRGRHPDDRALLAGAGDRRRLRPAPSEGGAAGQPAVGRPHRL